MRLRVFRRRENLDYTVDFADPEPGQRRWGGGQLVRDVRALPRTRCRMAGATQPALRRVQPQLAALMRADPGHRLQLGVGAMHEPVDRAEVERKGPAIREVGARTD